ncbi:SbcC/MukB-like Walker B domain-containing protein [Paraglaciecola aquimarina]|uniref:SbcC/MukB-like Walker B domain-containing protein n=1 Tax=Paraglaciecola aquimarina TaxID=1235557 RepID=A0ABU3SVI9_9ALTE|nr:SbcC/MukB-like Walker B domain-containing protein [Paraglaciecola aquimarina]MDU0354045.1 SbcC/MukB-like Walker B domain-containing protein [Paraglaciecola aquimarina]
MVRCQLRYTSITALAKQKLNELQAGANTFQLLSGEQKQHLEDELAEIQKTQTKLEQQISQQQNHLSWWDKRTTAEQNQQAANAQFAHAKQAIIEAQTELSLLEKSEPAERLRPSWQALVESTAQQQKTQQQLLNQQQTKIQLQAELKAMSDKLLVAEQTLAAAKKAQQTQEQLITEQVQPLDSQIINLADKLTDKEQVIARLQQQQQQATANQQRLTMVISELTEQHSTSQNYLTTHQADGAVAEQLSGWNAALAQLQRDNQSALTLQQQSTTFEQQASVNNNKLSELTTQSQRLSDNLQQLQNELAAKHSEYQKLNQQADVASLETQLANSNQQWLGLHKAQDIQRRYLQLSNEQQKLQTELANSQQQVTEFSQQRKVLGQQFQAQEQQCKDLQQLVSQEEQLAQYRQLLTAGQACPLCGATEHPESASMQIDIPDTVSRKQQAESLLKQLEQEGKAVREKLDSVKLQLKQQENRLAELSRGENELTQQWQQQAQTLGLNFAIQQQAGLQDFEQNLKNQLEQISNQLRLLSRLDKACSAAKEAVNTAERQQDKLNSEINLLQQSQQTLQQNKQKAMAEYQQLLESVHNNRQNLVAHIVALGYSAPADDALAEWIQNKVQDVKLYQQKSEEKEQLSQQLAAKSAERTALEQQLQSIVEQLSNLQTEATQLKQQWTAANAQRQQLFGDKTVQQARSETNSALEKAEQSHQVTSDSHRQITQQNNDLAAAINLITEQNSELELKLKEQNNKWQALLSSSPFSGQDEFIQALLPEAQRQQLTELKQQLDSQLQRANTLLEQSNQTLNALNQVAEVDLWLQTPAQAVQQQLIELQQQKDAIAERRGGISSQLAADQQESARQQSVLQQIEQQKQDYDQLSYLHGLIGSASGDKFRRFAQGLTLDNLVYLANKQLDRIHGRYLLKRKDEDGLALSVLDTWQGDVERDTKTLSGGESFLVSLALALALSDLVSHKTSIDSLFLDEGFGTLDAETLDIALDALDNLNASGKMIGVISHIEAMKERIPTQLRVTKKSGLGVSELEARFAIKAE